MASPNNAQDSEPGSQSNAARRLAFVGIAVVIVVIATLVGVLFHRSQKDGQPVRPSFVAPTTTAAPTGGQATGPAAVPIAPPGFPQPHTEGEDCSHDHIATRWQRRDGQWVCAAPGLVSGDHRVGDDCSHGDLTAHWVIGPGPAWLCAPNPGQDAGSPSPPSPPAPVAADGPVPAPAPDQYQAPVQAPAPAPEPPPWAPAPEPPPPPVFELPPIQLPPIFQFPPPPLR